MALSELAKSIAPSEVVGPLTKAHQVQLSPLVLQEDFHKVALRLTMLLVVTSCRQAAVCLNDVWAIYRQWMARRWGGTPRI